MVNALTPLELKELHVIVHRECRRALCAARRCTCHELREYASVVSRIDAKIGNMVSKEFLKEGEEHAE